MGNDEKTTWKISKYYMWVEAVNAYQDTLRSEFSRFFERWANIYPEIKRAKNELKMMVMLIFENGKNTKKVKNMEFLEKNYKISDKLIDKIQNQFMNWFNEAEHVELEMELLNIVGQLQKLKTLVQAAS